MTSGRHYIPGSTAYNADGNTYYKRAPSVSFGSSELTEFVFIKDGLFKGAVLKACGNPVSATPKIPTPPPPAPKQSLTCHVLTKVSIDTKTRTVNVKLVGSAANTSITGYRIDWSDGKSSNTQTA